MKEGWKSDMILMSTDDQSLLTRSNRSEKRDACSFLASKHFWTIPLWHVNKKQNQQPGFFPNTLQKLFIVVRVGRVFSL